MEEDIKILEDFIKYFEAEAISRKYRRNISITVGEDDIEAIENLLKAYRELEKNNERLEARVKRYEKYLENKDKRLEEALEYEFQERETYYIEKSKVKEKIEEVEQYIEHVDFNEGQAMYKVLKELLEEE